MSACLNYKHQKWAGIHILAPIQVVIETGMRLQEVLNVRLQDIEFGRRRLTIIKSKTDHKTEWKGRTIVLSLLARGYLEKYLDYQREHEGRELKPSDLVFPLPYPSFKDLPAKVYKLAGITNLTFHDLRKEFASRVSEFEDEGYELSEPQLAIMLGHDCKTQTQEYVQRNLETLLRKIQNKLDMQQIGMTWAELVERVKKNNGRINHRDIFNNILKRHNRDGIIIVDTIYRQLEAEELIPRLPEVVVRTSIPKNLNPYGLL